MELVLKGTQDEIEIACAKFHVRKLWAFGSVVKGKFTLSSDVDFAVEFAEPPADMGLFDQYLGLKIELERITDRQVDLVEWPFVTNPFFRRNVEGHRELIYAV